MNLWRFEAYILVFEKSDITSRDNDQSFTKKSRLVLYLPFYNINDQSHKNRLLRTFFSLKFIFCLFYQSLGLVQLKRTGLLNLQWHIKFKKQQSAAPYQKSKFSTLKRHNSRYMYPKRKVLTSFSCCFKPKTDTFDKLTTKNNLFSCT